MDLTQRRRVLLSAQKLLPSAYQRVEYIEGTGTQCIDSGIECTSDLAVEFSFQVPTLVNASLCGGFINASPNFFRHHGSPYTFPDSGANYMYNISDGKDRIPTTIQPPQVDTKYDVYVDPQLGSYHMIGENYNVEGTFEPLPYLTTGSNYGILARIASTGAIQSRPSKIYYFKFWRNQKLIGDFVPCYRKSDNVAGMYDFVTKTFFTNAGSGTIGVGPDV